MTPVLEASGLVKKFGLKRGRHQSYLHAVDDVGLVIRPGEAVGLVGESGCGKSTLARLLSRLIERDSGELRLNGAGIDQISVARFASSPQRRQIQMVFQDPTDSLNPRFSAFEAIADPVRILLRPKNRAELEERVMAAADRVGLARELLPRFPHQLSGGQKARVGIARAMAVEPRLLILDEPTSALDVSVQATVLNLLLELRRSHGLTYLFISHDLSVVERLCDRVAIMYLGRIVEQAATRDIFEQPRHPYTRALLAAAPRLEGGKPDRSMVALGEPAGSSQRQPGCAFAPRCAYADDRCRTTGPVLQAAGPEHSVACHRWQMVAASFYGLDSDTTPRRAGELTPPR